MSNFTFGCWLFMAFYIGASFGSEWEKNRRNRKRRLAGLGTPGRDKP